MLPIRRYRAPLALWLALTALGCVALARGELQRLQDAENQDVRTAADGDLDLGHAAADGKAIDQNSQR